MDREIRRLLDKAKQQNFRIREGKHITIMAPDGGIIVVPKTPSDWRSLLNTRALLKRHGLK